MSNSDVGQKRKVGTGTEHSRLDEKNQHEWKSKHHSTSVSSGSKSKISISLGMNKSKHTPVNKPTADRVTKMPVPEKKPKLVKTASVFEEDSSEEEEEEMPKEAKLRMRNLGKETHTSAGPNSFSKGSFGFCDRNAMMKKELEKRQQEVADD